MVYENLNPEQVDLFMGAMHKLSSLACSLGGPGTVHLKMGNVRIELIFSDVTGSESTITIKSKIGTNVERN